MRPFVLRPLPRSFLALAAALLPFAAFGAARAVADPDGAALPPPLSAAQLDEIVAPVALYPDVVLDALLPAAASPVDVVAAARYVAAQGGSVQGAPDGSTWDVNVVALLQYPDVLQWMGENPDWVERIGFAVATQQADVLAAIQRYRARAQAAGALASNEYRPSASSRAP